MGAGKRDREKTLGKIGGINPPGKEHTMNYNEIMQELAEYTRILEEARETVEGLKGQLKDYMKAEGLDTLRGTDHKATYKAVTSSRLDTTAIKTELPDIVARYTKQVTTERFTFV